MISVQKLSYHVGGTPLLKEVSHTFAPKRITVLLGPNGAGKSTLIRLLAGLLKPSGGNILLDERPLQQWTKKDLAVVRAYLPQTHALTFPMSVAEVLKLGQFPYSTPKDEETDQAKAFAEVLQAFRLEPLANRSYTTLSGGEQQRVQIARVMLQLWSRPIAAPTVFLLDEPLNGLDLKHQQNVLQVIRSVAETGRTCLLALHDINIAAQVADDLVFLKNGSVFDAGSVETVFTEPVLRSVFDVEVRLLGSLGNERPTAVMPFI